jgi:hypothetical protein
VRAWVVFAALLAAGCGGAAERAASAGTPAPTPRATATAAVTPAHLRARIRPATARQLDAGAVGVVGFDLRGGVAPSALMVNKEQTLQGLRWSGWGAATASGRGQVRTVVCDPTCAEGRLEYSRATVVLSRVRTCGRRRFYTAAKVTYLDPSRRRTLTPSALVGSPC